MTELERTKYAKQYLDSLSEGVNPLSGEILPESDIVNDVHICRCLKFVSGILSEVINNGGVARESKVRKAEFSITDERLSSYRFSKEPVPISEISKRISELKEREDMKTCSHTMLTDWLLNEGFLQIVPDRTGAKKKLPTENGFSIGMSTEKREGAYGTYTIVLYNEDAQHLIIDNMDAIMECRKIKKESRYKAVPFTDSQDMALRQMMRSGTSVAQIAMLLKRSESDIHKRIKELKELDGDEDKIPSTPYFTFADDGSSSLKTPDIDVISYYDEDK